MAVGYPAIVNAWYTGDSMNDIYHMILDFLEGIRDTADASIQTEVNDWLMRAKRGDETNDLVEEFIYGESYHGIRSFYEECRSPP